MSGAECVREGFADKVIQPVRAMAQLHSKRLEEFEHMPQNIKNMIIAPQGNARTLTQPEPQAIVTPPPVAVTTPAPQPVTPLRGRMKSPCAPVFRKSSDSVSAGSRMCLVCSVTATAS